MTSEKKQHSKTFPLRLPSTMRRELESLAMEEGISINSFISLAIAEKITRLSYLSDVNAGTAKGEDEEQSVYFGHDDRYNPRLD